MTNRCRPATFRSGGHVVQSNTEAKQKKPRMKSPLNRKHKQKSKGKHNVGFDGHS